MIARQSLGRAIRQRRESIDVSLGDLSATTGLSPFTINAIERGRRGPSLEALLDIADALSTTVRELLTGVPPWDDSADSESEVST